ncbi:MAG: hypothetical protein GY720_18865, partial [bacterium]|nr:hypothetical protein [bacterium]
IYELNVDQFDTNGDGIAVIDIDMGDNDFKLTNSNWIIESENNTFAIFRILKGSNLVLNQSTIMVGDGIHGNGGNAGPPTGGAVDELRAIFVVANDYNNGRGGRNQGESLSSGDTTLSFNDTVLNGVGFYDLIVFGGNDAQFDNGKTELKINNGQGCAQFVSPKINFNDVRFERCAPSEGGDEPQTNEAEATGSVMGETPSDTDSQTIIVTASGGGGGGDPIQVFYDSFENGAWNGLWTEDSQGDWFTSSQRSTAGSRSAEVDGRAEDAELESIPIGLQGGTTATITFDWYIERGLDNGEYLAFDVSTDGGSTWVQKA